MTRFSFAAARRAQAEQKAALERALLRLPPEPAPEAVAEPQRPSSGGGWDGGARAPTTWRTSEAEVLAEHNERVLELVRWEQARGGGSFFGGF